MVRKKAKYNLKVSGTRARREDELRGKWAWEKSHPGQVPMGILPQDDLMWAGGQGIASATVEEGVFFS